MNIQNKKNFKELSSSKKLFEQTNIWKSMIIVVSLAVGSSLISGLYVFADQVLMTKILSVNNNFFVNDLLNKMGWQKIINGINSGEIIDKYNLMGNFQKKESTISSVIRISNSSLSPIILLCTATSLLVGLGTSIPYSKALGKKDMGEIQNIFSNGVFNGVIISLISTIILMSISNSIISSQISADFPKDADEQIKNFLLKKREMSIKLATNYSLIICGFNLLNISSTFLASMLNSEGKNYVPTLVLLTSNIINIFLDYILLQFTNSGMNGSAIATVISYTISNTLFFLYLFKKNKENDTFINLKLVNINIKNINWSIILSIILIGSASFFRSGSVAIYSFFQQHLYSTITNKITGKVPNYYVDILGAIMPIYNLFFSAVIGVIRGARTVLSYNYGLKNRKRIISSFWIANLLTFFYGLIFYILVCPILTTSDITNGGFLWFFDITPSMGELYNDSISILNINMLQLVIFSFSVSGMLYFQSTGKIIFAIIFSLGNSLIVGLPTLWILSFLATNTNNIFLYNISPLINTLISGIVIFCFSIWYIHKKDKII